MKKIQKSSELLWVLGTVFVALGVCVCSKADLGVSMIAAPAFILSEALSKVFPFFSVGVTEYLIQGVILIVLCLVIRKFNWKFLFAFVVAILYGYTLDLFLWIFSGISFDAVWLRYVMLIVGDLITAFGVACFFHTYLPLQVYELFVSKISSTFNRNINKVKWCFDISLLVISIALALSLFGDPLSFDWSCITYKSFHSIGIGTLITTIINSPLIRLMSAFIERVFGRAELFPKIKKFISY